MTPRQDSPPNSRNLSRIAVVTLVAATVLLISSAFVDNARAYDIRSVLIRCCLSGQEFANDGGLLLLQEPITFQLIDLAGLEPYNLDIFKSFLNSLSSKSNITLSLDDTAPPPELTKSGLVLVALPAERSDFTSEKLRQTRNLFARFYTAASHSDNEVDAAFNSIIDHLYAIPGPSSQYTLLKAPDHLLGVLTLARMISGNIAAPETMEPVVLQSLGYNVAGAQIANSIFSAPGPDPMIIGLTELDYDALRTIYRRKDVRIIRSLSDIALP